MSTQRIARHPTRKITLRSSAPEQHVMFEDQLAVEEPLEIHINGEPMAVVMRTPGDDFALAAGFLHAEGFLESARNVGSIRHGEPPDKPASKNIVNITYAAGYTPDLTRLRRSCYATSSCGVCGKASAEQIRTHAKPIQTRLKVRLDVIYGLGHSLKKAQTLVVKAGGLHAAGVFDEHGVMLCLYEDVGRHNSVDKAIGHMLLQDKMPLDRRLLMVSGRTSFEVVQKAIMARIPIVCAVSAPSSLAVEAAREFGVTLVGFLREDDFNVYTHLERIEL